jgi:hypothetical protein
MGVAQYALAAPGFETALRHIERAEALERGNLDSLRLRGRYIGLTGHREPAESVLPRMKELPEVPGTLREDAIAQVYACAGDRAECFRWLERCVGPRSISVFNGRENPLFTDITRDPRFRDALRRAGLE